MASCVITGHLVAALCRTADFRSEDNDLLMRGDRAEIRRWHAEASDTALGEAWVAASTKEAPSVRKDTEDGGVAVRAPLHNQWDGSRDTVM